MGNGAAVEALKRHASGMRDNTARKIEAAMETIAREVGENEGLYPYNKGKVTQAEVCRRAGVRVSTLQGMVHRGTTLKALNEWLAGMRQDAIHGRKAVRTAITERVNSWKEAYHQVAHNYHVARLELSDVQARLRDREDRVRELERALARLQHTTSDGKVLPLVGRR